MAPILSIVRVLAQGRASEILELGDDRVLRRFKAGGRPAREAEVMSHVQAHGYPVPGVIDVLDDALVLERVDGQTMLADLRRRPWRMSGHARLLADLHHRLHAIPFDGERLLHLDFHPDNVLLSRRGPVVIDWANARAGEPALDVAMTWVICATSGGGLGRLFTRLFLRHVDRSAARKALGEAAELRIADPNVTDEERVRVRSLLRRMG
jgi:aminoglycoside phosphotransferase (APT) family kinase protein